MAFKKFSMTKKAEMESLLEWLLWIIFIIIILGVLYLFGKRLLG